MKIKNVHAIYFSPTFHTKKIATSFIKEIKEDYTNMDITPYNTIPKLNAFLEEDLVCVACPVYGGRVPSIFIEKLKTLTGNNTPAVIIVSYGNRDYDDALLELKDTLNSLGFKVIGAGAFIAEHSLISGLAENRPNKLDLSDISSFAENILHKLKNIKHIKKEKDINVKGNRPYREYGGSSISPKVSKKCVFCGKCANECPVGAIDKKKLNATDKDKCIGCMRCVNICPEGARSINKLLVSIGTRKIKNNNKAPKSNEVIL